MITHLFLVFLLYFLFIFLILLAIYPKSLIILSSLFVGVCLNCLNIELNFSIKFWVSILLTNVVRQHNIDITHISQNYSREHPICWITAERCMIDSTGRWLKGRCKVGVCVSNFKDTDFTLVVAPRLEHIW